jgi:hypothetical protein
VLQGRALPPPFPLPPLLRPLVEGDSVAVFGTAREPVRAANPPELAWPPLPGAGGYEFESSATAEGKRVRYDTAYLGIAVPEPRFTIPAFVWDQAPAGVPIEWQVIASRADRRVIVARGVLVRVLS